MNLARTGKMKRRLVEGHSFIGAPAIKVAHGDEDRSVVQDDASFSTLGASYVATEYRQVSEILVQPVVAAQSSVASAAPAYFYDTGTCWHGLSAGGNGL